LIAALGEWRDARGPLFIRLADALIRAAAQGAVAPGGELPAERTLAGALAVSRPTVAAAYRELRERGVAVTRHGSGTVIRSELPPGRGASWATVSMLVARAHAASPMIDLSVAAPVLDEAVSKLVVSGASLGGHVEDHGYAPLGWPALRARVAELLSCRGLSTTPEEVLITNGGQEAISLAVGLATGDGHRIAVESPGTPGALEAIAHAGGRPLAIGRDAGGLRIDQLKRALETQHIHALFLAPACNYPTGGRTAEHRREQIVALAEQHDFIVIEDNVLEALTYENNPGPPLWTLAPDRVLAIGSLNTVVWGGLRVGWLRAPRPVVLRLGRIKGALNLGVGAFDQLAALQLLEHHDQLCTVRREQAKSHMQALGAALDQTLPDWPIALPVGGWSLWIALPAGSATAFSQAALRHRVAIGTGAATSPDNEFPEHISVCFGPAPPILEEAARRLAAAWSEFNASAASDAALTGG
jgi:DNA-binding transcriptional MocR family regulator